MRSDAECRIIIKTTRERYVQLEQAILELHSYDLPAIHAVAIDAIHGPYGDWIVQCCEAEIQPHDLTSRSE